MTRILRSSSGPALLTALLLPGLAPSVAAQQAEWAAGAGVRFELYAFGAPEEVDLDRVTLLTVPLVMQAPLTRQLELRVASTFARGTVTRATGDESTLSGLTDTEVRLTLGLARDRLRLSAIGLLPTGKTDLTAEEMDVAGVIAADMLPFAITNWGTGGGVGLSAAAALPFGEQTAFGLSAGYVVASEFEPVADTDFAYRPGDQLHLRAAVDRTIGSAGKVSLQLTYLRFSDDRSAGTNIYQAGDRLQAVGSYAFAAGGTANGIVYAGYLRRQEGNYTVVTLVTPAQDLVFAGAGLRLPWRNLLLQPTLDLRVLGTEDGVGQGYTVSAGTGVEVPLGRALLVPNARARFGSLTVRSGQDSGLTGVELGLAVRSRGVLP
ncbi:MAG TPA: hypothetical protein VK928_09675 [Longimicrobiales bacterium]|nr:hypothetical protein [Longimicrobiales bacterium]